MAVNNEDVIGLIRLAVQTSSATQSRLSGQSLTTALGGRVFGPALVDADAGTVERPCLIVDVNGGEREYGGAVESVYVNLYAYADDGAGKALALYDAAYSILEGVRLVDPDGAISIKGVMRETVRPLQGFNDTMKSHYARGTWRVILAG